MYSILVHAHSGLRWVLLLLLVMTVLRAIGGMSGNKPYTDGMRKLALFTMIFTHVQILLGLILYAISPKVQFGAETMSDSVLRFFAVEHFVMMILAAVLITMGNRRSKSGATDQARYKSVFWFYLIGFVLIMAAIPWPFRGLGSWF